MQTKAELRSELAESRRRMPSEQREEQRAAIRAHVGDWCEQAGLASGARIAAYEPLATEPGSIELLAQLTRAGWQVIVPMTQPDRDLDWGVWTLTRQARRPLGLDAIGTAALILVPAFAVDRAGNRLGRGGGSYDRALARAATTAPVGALLFTGEVQAELPVDEWDRPVTAAVTPQGWQPLPRA
jgi:5-formyltetrahydrofolate cyclo-ligase